MVGALTHLCGKLAVVLHQKWREKDSKSSLKFVLKKTGALEQLNVQGQAVHFTAGLGTCS